jgi:hypothetical protein
MTPPVRSRTGRSSPSAWDSRSRPRWMGSVDEAQFLVMEYNRDYLGGQIEEP